MIEVFDYRTHLDANAIVRPELRGRFLRLEPSPAPPPHSHDVAGEAFLVLEGQCEFIVENERATCGPGQMVYVDKGVLHSLHAIGSEPCVLYLSVTPHIEPTHTFYDDHGQAMPIRYDAWQGHRTTDGAGQPGLPAADSRFDDGTLIRTLVGATQHLAELSQKAATRTASHGQELDAAVALRDGERAKEIVDEIWLSLRDVLSQVSDLEEAWNAVGPQAMRMGAKPN